MKILQTEITPGINSFISIIERDLPFFNTPFHFHPELELVYIKEGYGKRIIGDNIAPFEAGDMLFIGSNLPHVWMSDDAFHKGNSHLRAKAIVLYFNKDIFGPAFYSMQEAGKIKELFQKAARGMRVGESIHPLIARQLEELLQKKDIEKIIGLLDILHQLSCATDSSYITSEGYNPCLAGMETDRLAGVQKYVQEHYKNNISLHTVAGMVNLTKQSFCRLFRQRTNKHFVEYLNEVRISNACKYLLDTDLGVAEIAHHCGYKTVSNFNKLFKKLTGTSPREYRTKSVL